MGWVNLPENTEIVYCIIKYAQCTTTLPYSCRVMGTVDQVARRGSNLENKSMDSAIFWNPWFYCNVGYFYLNRSIGLLFESSWHGGEYRIVCDASGIQSCLLQVSYSNHAAADRSIIINKVIPSIIWSVAYRMDAHSCHQDAHQRKTMHPKRSVCVHTYHASTSCVDSMILQVGLPHQLILLPKFMDAFNNLSLASFHSMITS